MATFAELETNIQIERKLEGISATKAVVAEQVEISVASAYNVINKVKQQSGIKPSD